MIIKAYALRCDSCHSARIEDPMKATLRARALLAGWGIAWTLWGRVHACPTCRSTSTTDPDEPTGKPDLSNFMATVDRAANKLAADAEVPTHYLTQ